MFAVLYKDLITKEFKFDFSLKKVKAVDELLVSVHNKLNYIITLFEKSHILIGYLRKRKDFKNPESR